MTRPYPNFLGSCITTIFKLVIAGVECKGLHNIGACAKELTMQLSYWIGKKIKENDSVNQNFTGSLSSASFLEERDPANEVCIQCMSRNFRASAFAFLLEANFRLNLTCIRILGSSGHWTRVGCFFFFRQWLCEWMFWHKYACRMYLKKSPTYPWKAKWSTPLYKLECLLS